MGMYKDMILSARESGRADEKMMWAEIDNVDKLLKCIKKAHPDLYWQHIRDTHETLYGKHYDEDFAREDVRKLHYTDKNGIKRYGERWSPEEVLVLTQAKQHPRDVTDWDRYVAYNAMYADLCRDFEDEEILKVAYLFFFNDEDWSEDGSAGKVWEYMRK